MRRLRLIAVSEDVYSALLSIKHEFEKKEKRTYSFSDVLKKLLKKGGGNGCP